MKTRQGGFVIAAMCCFSLVSGSLANAAIINGGFETGDLTGWTGTNYASAVSSVSASGGGPGDPAGGIWTPYQGNYFGLVQSGAGAGVYSMLSQSFSVASGDQLTLAVFFDAGDYLPFDDNGYVTLINAGDSSTVNLYAESVSTVGTYGGNGWTAVSYTFTSAGTWSIEAGVANQGDNGGPYTTQLGVDVVALSSAAVPEPTTMAIWGGLGLAGLIAARRRKRIAA